MGELRNEMKCVSCNNTNLKKELQEAKEFIDVQRAEHEELSVSEVQYFKESLNKLESKYVEKLNGKDRELALVQRNLDECREVCKVMECYLMRKEDSIKDDFTEINGLK